MTEPAARLPLASVALISGAVLGIEILLTRAFSIVHWHHFAYMVVSLALLGFGASGTFLSLTQRWMLPRLVMSYPCSLAAFGVVAIVSPLLAQRVPLRAEALLWDPWQPLWLLVVYVVLAAPFFCAATALGLALTAFRTSSGRIYAADLVGAGLGSLGTLAGLYWLPPEVLLRVVAATGLLAALVGSAELAGRVRPWAVATLLGCAVALLTPADTLRFDPGPYKGLSQALNVPGSHIVRERSSPLGRIDVVAPGVPLRHAPGLSVAATGEPPAQLAIFTDGDAMDVITAASSDLPTAAFLREATGALGYRVATPRSVLILGAGGGLEILRARAFGAQHIDALELNPQIVGLLRADFAGFTGGLVTQPGVELHVGDARGWLASTPRRYDLIVLSSGSAGAGGIGGLNEDYARTAEALDLYLRHLSPGGFLSITDLAQLPPRAGLKIITTVRAALEAADVANPAERLLMIRGWQTWTLLAGNAPVTAKQIQHVRAYADALSFDLVWHPGLERSETNRYNQLREPYFYDGVKAILGAERDDFVRRYAFNVEAATDDRPYFQDFFRWPLLDEVLDNRERGGMALLEAGYLLLIAVAIQAVIVGTVLILLPLAFGAPVHHVPAGARWRVFGYFAALGIAFLFLEIAYLQKLVLLVHHPTTAFALTLATFLLGAGCGSAWSSRVSAPRRRRLVVVAVAAIMALAALHAWSFNLLFDAVTVWSLPARAALACAVVLPLAFFMGVPFPTALSNLDEALVPWAWGINGCASVVSAALAALLAVESGFKAVVLVALGFYAVIPLLAPRRAES